jgi:hypothetical protein
MIRALVFCPGSTRAFACTKTEAVVNRERALKKQLQKAVPDIEADLVFMPAYSQLLEFDLAVDVCVWKFADIA